MDVRRMTQLLRLAAKGSLILLGSTVVLAGDRPHEQPTRLHMPATCSPNWGLNQTCWSRFPVLPPCQGSACSAGPQGYENYPSPPILDTPQNPMMDQNSQIVSPTFGWSQRPTHVFSDSPRADVDTSFGGMSTMPAEGTPYTTAPLNFGPSLPSAVPAIPSEQTQPSSSGPAVLNGLPPLPAPPISAPGHSSWQPNMNFNPNQQQMMRPVAASKQAMQSGARYGIAKQPINSPQIISPTAASMTSGSLTNTLVKSNQSPSRPANSPTLAGRYGSSASPGGLQTSGMPVAFASQSRVLPSLSGSSTSYRSGTSMPPIVNSPRAGFQQTQLPSMSNYPTMPVKPLRRTP